MQTLIMTMRPHTHSGVFWRACRVVGLTKADLAVCATAAMFQAQLRHRYHARVRTCHPDLVSGSQARKDYARVLRAHTWLLHYGWRRWRQWQTPTVPELPWPWAKGWEPSQWP